MRGMAIERIAAACRGSLRCSDDMRGAGIEAVVADSREVSEGSLFVAIKGERVDGHDFINAAFAAGARCCLCERPPENPAGVCIVVDSTERAIREIAAYYRSLFTIPVIGVTGSVGKTSAKEMIASVLSQRFNVLSTAGNFNNELGVPLTLFRLRDEHEIAVVEMGISDFSEMSRLAEMVRPDMAVFTVIGHAHLERLGSREGVLKAKGEMLSYMPQNGVVFVNGDDDLLVGMSCTQKKLTFGLGADSWARGEITGEPSEDGTDFSVSFGKKSFPAHIKNAFGVHMVTAALAGAAVGRHMGLSDKEIAEGVAAFKPVGSRARIIRHGGLRIVDDCYNANPDSVSAALRSMSSLSGRRVFILGDMLELGKDSAELHREIGRLAAKAGELTICCGPMARNIYDGVVENVGSAVYFAEKSELLSALSPLIESGDAVLVKASRGMRFEDITEKVKTFQVKQK